MIRGQELNHGRSTFSGTKKRVYSERMFITLRISGVKELGPLEENVATRGAGCAPNTVFALKILDMGLLLSITEILQSEKDRKCRHRSLTETNVLVLQT